MILEEQRFLHEDLERLEAAIADRVTDEPRHVRERLNRDHQIAGFLDRIQNQSKRLLDIYKDTDGMRSREIQTITTGDPFDEFYKQLDEVKTFHNRYPNEPLENLERAYRKKAPVEGEPIVSEIDNMFTGEEANGRFLDLTGLHELYVNLPGIKRPTYLQYLDIFDIFSPPVCAVKRGDKMTDQYFSYVGQLASYLEGFMRRTRPLENVDQILRNWDEDFDKAWEKNEVPGWGVETAGAAPLPSTGIYCQDCEKEFANQNVYNAHLKGKKHTRNAAAREARLAEGEMDTSSAPTNGAKPVSSLRLKERAIAERENRVRKLAGAMTQERSDTRVNVETKQGMTDKERQLHLEALFADSALNGGGENEDSDSDDDGEDKVYNPLKLPLQWDGKPIPFWLWKLHGLGVEFPCEICGNFVYFGRRAFDKHFGEARHVHGLRCLGITNTTLFREITGIEDALRLWEKLENERKKEERGRDVVQMEDGEGNVMPEKVYYDLQKQGLL